MANAVANGQTISQKILIANKKLLAIEQQRQQVLEDIEQLKLTKIQQQLDESGLPALQNGDELVKHAAMTIGYAPQYKQARWVAHIILPDVTNGTVYRTNDFREDNEVKSGSAVETDYFLKKLKPDSTYEYDGFGYDRGHLAPSADFRWSRTALSESYFYSNMSPQLPDFNRGAWGDLEDAIRGYIYSNPTSQLYVVTGPVLQQGLPVIERGTNKVAIPRQFFKVLIDPANKRGIAFLMPNAAITSPLKKFAVSIDSVETLTGLNFFNKFPDSLQSQMESMTDATVWMPDGSALDVEPLPQEKMARNHFNTTIAKQWAGQNNEISVCGTVVSARLSRNGNALLNLDKQYPNEVFTVFIKKADLVNFNYNPVDGLLGKVICVKGKVSSLGGKPTMYIGRQSDISIQ